MSKVKIARVRIKAKALKKPKRAYADVLRSLSKVLKINRDVTSPLWFSGEPEREHWGDWPIRVTIWNIFKGSGGDHFYNDLRLLCFQSDLILLQEALLSHRSMEELSLDGFQGVHGASYERADKLRDGVMSLARMRPHVTPKRILCKYPEPVLKTPKAALVTQYSVGHGKTLTVVNLHATLIRTIKRAQEELEHLIERLPMAEGPMIFAGDFNTFTPRYFRAVAETLERTLGLRYVKIPDDPRRPVDHLDQIFVRGMDVHSIEIDTRIHSSDHFPIRAIIKILPD
ncbi:MAG: endonuclease/exonuclease/phosphatase family protein [Chitinophagaceae bacterium]|nr:endonuclease/exonuclease/phosphatase family protein [Oligoflexus sp.]